MGKDQQPVNVWAAGGALKAKNKTMSRPAMAAASNVAKAGKGGKAVKPTKAKKGKQPKGAKPSKATKPSKPKQQMVQSNGSTSAWTSRASVASSNHQVNNGHGVNAKLSKSSSSNSQPKGAKKGNSNASKAGKAAKPIKPKNGKSNRSKGNNSNHHHPHIGNNRNIEAVNKVSPELQKWLRSEIKKLNPDVDTVSVAHLLLTLDDDTVRTTAVHTFGNNSEVSTFIDSFLTHRSHDIQEQKHKGASKVKMGGRGGHKKKNNKSRR